MKTTIGYRIFRYTLSLWAGAAAYVIIEQAGAEFFAKPALSTWFDIVSVALPVMMALLVDMVME